MPHQPHPQGSLLAEGARFNDEIHRLPTGNTSSIPKGLCHFLAHAEANQHELDCLAKGMAKTISLEGLLRTKQTMHYCWLRKKGGNLVLSAANIRPRRTNQTNP